MSSVDTALPPLTSRGHVVEGLDLMRDSNDALHDVGELRARMQRDGYLYLPGLLNKEWVLDARRSIAEKLQAEGVLHPDYPLMDCVNNPQKKMSFRPDLTVKNERVIKLLYSGNIMTFFDRFLGAPTLHFDFTWLRVMCPGGGTQSHCDIVYMGRGTQQLYTAWTPFGDVPFEQGGLIVLEGSNNHERLRNTYGKKDVDSFCTNKTGRQAQHHWAFGNGGGLSQNPNQISRQLGGRWLTAEYKLGDALFFTAHTVHASIDNKSKHIRISSDSRYQLASDPVDERWVGENPVGHGAAGKRGKIC